MPPRDDGGMPMDGYLIEQREAYRFQWTETGETTGTEFTVRGLKSGAQYIFRVMAANRMGVGEPAELTQGIQPKEQYGELRNRN